MGGICFCRCQSENPFVCFGAKPSQRACAWDLPRDRKDEGRKSDRTVDKGEEKKTVGMRGQSREGNSQEKGTTETSRQNRSVNRWADIARGFVRVSAWVNACISSQNTQKVSQTPPPLALGADPSPCLFFSSTLSFLLWLSVKQCEILPRWEKPLDESLAMSGLRELR